MYALYVMNESGYITGYVAKNKKILKPLMNDDSTIAYRLRDETGWCESKNWKAFGLHRLPFTCVVLWQPLTLSPNKIAKLRS